VRPSVLVTRPLPDALDWVRALRAQGHAAQALPLLAIEAQIAPRWPQQPARWRALMFVSGNAVRHFFARPRPGGVLQAQHIWAPGPGTVRTLLAHGIAPRRITSPPPHAAQFDSEALWHVVQGQIRPGDAVLIVRGSHMDAAEESSGAGRDWLAARLREAGAQVAFVAVYRRTLPAWSAAQQRTARRCAADGSVWLLSSGEAVRHLQQLVPGQNWQHARALATHARIACAAARLGFGHIDSCRPTLQDVAGKLAR